MNAIVGLTHLALKTDLDARQRDHLEKISTASNNLLRILNDILDSSKIEPGKLELERIGFDLTEVLDSVIQICGVKAEDKGIDFPLSTQPGLPRALVGDPLRLGQVLINFANNAVKFTSAGRILVDVSVVHEDDDEVELRFAVTDTGVGIAPE